ncbi:GAST1 protein homolog 4 [Hibiscus trionum]|uniref:GAST1 protein homolog 4 n=1 Tax=Hibiscus trionum TaxID=183268 RepID=A0A9W7H784_HIBTR|nr:GAST1 protein homolog 4 [Hibiscus trionum]
MARLSWLPFAFFLVLIVFTFVAIQTTNAGKEGSLRLQDCPNACNVRCSQTQYRNACLEFCNYCCQRCLCVPSGYYGHTGECPCYDNIMTKEGKHKCP